MIKEKKDKEHLKYQIADHKYVIFCRVLALAVGLWNTSYFAFIRATNWCGRAVLCFIAFFIPIILSYFALRDCRLLQRCQALGCRLEMVLEESQQAGTPEHGLDDARKRQLRLDDDEEDFIDEG